jgi:predicted MFS family arabinose efflux permease
MGALLLPVIILLVSPAASGQRVLRLGVLTPGGWAESPVPQVMVSELAAFGADHDRQT